MLLRNRSLAPRVVHAKRGAGKGQKMKESKFHSRPAGSHGLGEGSFMKQPQTQMDINAGNGPILEDNVQGADDTEPGNPQSKKNMIPDWNKNTPNGPIQVPISKADKGGPMGAPKFHNRHPVSKEVHSSAQPKTGQKYKSGGHGGSFGHAATRDAGHASIGSHRSGGLPPTHQAHRGKKFVSKAGIRSGKGYKKGVKNPPSMNMRIASFGGLGV